MEIQNNYSLVYKIKGAANEVYNTLGPGLLESVYEKALLHELSLIGLKAYSQIPVPIIYKGELIASDLRLDIIVKDSIVLELKSVEEIKPIYFKQLRTYLKLLNKPEGLLINFGEYDFKKGIMVVKNPYYKSRIQ